MTKPKVRVPFCWIKELKEDEEATQIKGFPAYYVTTHGRVYSTKTYRWLKDYDTDEQSYHRAVMLRENGKYTCINVHTLVGRAFLKWAPGQLILHIDETLPLSEVNHLSNLRVGTHADNMADMASKGRAINRYMKAK